MWLIGSTLAFGSRDHDSNLSGEEKFSSFGFTSNTLLIENIGLN